MNTSAKIVLITGCSTGIGRDLAERLSQAGYSVVATARRTETMADLPVALKLPLDVTQPDSVNQAVMRTLAQFGRIDVLVNNAGYAQFGAVEEIPIEKVQQRNRRLCLKSFNRPSRRPGRKRAIMPIFPSPANWYFTWAIQSGTWHSGVCSRSILPG